MSKYRKWGQLATLPFMLVLCVLIWSVLGVGPKLEVYSEDGVWDLRDFDFSSQYARTQGYGEYIPGAILTPEEYALRADEAIRGNPPNSLDCYTSRSVILVPEGTAFKLGGNSIDYADRLYINGVLMAEMGSPADNAAENVPDTGTIRIMDVPEDGRFEIIRNGSNYVHREGGNPFVLNIGLAEQKLPSDRYDVTLLIMGCFFALFLVHLTMFCIIRSYPANLFFSLFCLVWMLRAGVTGPKVLSTLLPSLSWYLKFRIEYISLPATAMLLTLLIRELFPGVLSRWFVRAILGLSLVFIVLFSVLDTKVMSYAMMGCYGYLCLGILGVLVFFIMRFRHPRMEQVVSLSGLALFLYAGVRDMFYFSNRSLPPYINADFGQVSMLIFVFFLMTSMFIGTMEAAERAKAVEQQMAAENAALDRMSRMKSDLIATISHETRTPLAVLSGYAELISMEMRHKGVDDQTAADLAKIAGETKRLSSIMTEMQKLSSGRDVVAQKAWVGIGELIEQTARLYTPILARERTELILDIDKDLPQVYASANELTQVLFNLLSNAGTHTHGGFITVRAYEKDGVVEVRIEDTGEGMRTEFIPQAFERYEHESDEGTGLGLFLCREIVEGHGGRIWIESELAKGTAITFAIPIASKETEHA